MLYEPPPHDGTPPQLRVLLSSADRNAVLRLAGEIDFTAVSIVADAVARCLRERPAQMTVDLRSVTFCDCAGVRVLQRAQCQAAAAGAGFRLTGLKPPVRRVLTLARATGLLAAAGGDRLAYPAAGA